MPKHLSQETITAMHAKHAEGVTLKQIAVQLGIGYSTVQRYISTGRTTAATKTHLGKLTGAKGRLKRILKMRAKGLTFRECGAKEGINPATAAYYVYHAQGKVDTHGHPTKRSNHIRPIVLGAETVAQVDQQRMRTIIDFVWSNLPFDDKLRAIESISSKGEPA